MYTKAYDCKGLEGELLIDVRGEREAYRLKEDRYYEFDTRPGRP